MITEQTNNKNDKRTSLLFLAPAEQFVYADRSLHDRNSGRTSVVNNTHYRVHHYVYYPGIRGTESLRLKVLIKQRREREY